MRQPSDWHEDMERFALDPDTAERLLSGALRPEDAPHRYGEVASLLRIAAGPTSGALEGEVAAVSTVVEAIRSSPAPAPTRHRVGAGNRLKAATAGLVVALTLASGLAAANALPAPAQEVAADALSVVGVHVPSPSSAPDTRARRPASVTSQTSVSPSSTVTSPRTVTTTAGLAPKTPAVTVPPTTAATVASQPGAGAGRTQDTSPPASNPQSGPAPQSAPAPNGAGTGHSATPTPTTAPPQQKQAERSGNTQRTGGTNGSAGADGSSGADGTTGTTQPGN